MPGNDLLTVVADYFRKGNRFQEGDPRKQIVSPYDYATEFALDMLQRGIKPFSVRTLNLSVARDNTNPMVIQELGFHVVMFGYDNTSPIKAVNTQAFANMQWGAANGLDNLFPMKHARGYSGPFETLTLTWPAQANIAADLIIYKNIWTPYMDGESCT